MLGLQTSFMNFIHELRIDELNISKKFRKLLVWNMAFGESVPYEALLSMMQVELTHLFLSLVDSHFRTHLHFRSVCRHFKVHIE